MSGVSIVLMNNSTTLLQNEVLACFFESLSSLAESSVYCLLVELYPTRLRVMATALGLSMGRAGALFGSLMFGYLVELNCFVPVSIFAALLFISAVISCFLPDAGEILDWICTLRLYGRREMGGAWWDADDYYINTRQTEWERRIQWWRIIVSYYHLLKWMMNCGATFDNKTSIKTCWFNCVACQPVKAFIFLL